MHRFFICNQDEVDSKLSTLIKTGTSEDECTDYYIDKNSNEEWLLVYYASNFHENGVQVLKRIPEPTIDELINIAMKSQNSNEIVGASVELSEREKYNKENFRNKLLNQLLEVDISLLTDFEKIRLKMIIYESNLYDGTNRRDIVGKHYTEILKDADYYKTIAKKAKKILDDIGR